MTRTRDYELPKVMCPKCKTRWLMSGFVVGILFSKICRCEVYVNSFDAEAAKRYIARNEVTA